MLDMSCSFRLHGEGGDASMANVNLALQELPALLEQWCKENGLNQEDVFNMDETGVLWKMQVK
jgi:hypothetical protein